MTREKGIEFIFDISKNDTKSFDLALNESEKEDGIVHLYLKVNNITMDINSIKKANICLIQ